MAQSDNKENQELSLLRLYHKSVLEVLEPGIIMLDSSDQVMNENESSSKLWGIPPGSLQGKPIRDTMIVRKCPELMARIHDSYQFEGRARFQCRLEHEGAIRVLEITIRPVLGDSRLRVGTLLYVEDVSVKEKLQQTVERLEATSEELQSVNEELETTNEELQSTNEELETTKEELQSLNEELETTNEELQSLNEELENMNEELEFRTRELDALSGRYSNTLEQMPWAVALVEESGRIQFWNSAAEKLFKLPASVIVGLDLGQLPFQEKMRQALLRRFRLVLEHSKPVILKEQQLLVGRTIHVLQIHFTLVERQGAPRTVLILFGPFPPQFLAEKKRIGKPANTPKVLKADSGRQGNGVVKISGESITNSPQTTVSKESKRTKKKK
jgi:two-component system CheB/CheR fusion protein